MEENSKKQKKPTFTFSSLLRGQIVKDVLCRDIWFVLYIFLITILYISINLGLETVTGQFFSKQTRRG